jgi:endonuclease III
MRKPSISQVITLLASAYGDRKWQKRNEPVGELVQTILSQNTSDTNSGRAFASLIGAFKDWRDIAHAPEGRIAEAIRQGGLADVKAKYIKSALLGLEKATPGFDLSFLGDMDLNDARRWLVKLPGVGMKTASCVLLFAMGVPAFPVDTHVYRVAGRLHLITPKLSVDKAHFEMERITPPQDVYRCHVLIIEHGRRTCKAQRPLCPACTLAGICPSYKLFVQ